MNKKKILRLCLLAACVLVLRTGHAQTSVLGNVPGSPGTDYVGWTGTTPVALEVRHNGPFPIEFYTDSLGRMRLGEATNNTINTFPGINQAGFLLLTGTPNALTNAASLAPFTRLHLIDPAVSANLPGVYAQQFGFRNWQRNGITFTGNNDHAYLGQRYWLNDQTDFVVQWSDNAANSPWGIDRMKFIFTSAFNAGALRGATTANGLEAIRLLPANLLEVFVGIGDYAQPGLVQPDPTERLDVLDGRVRIRQLPDDPAAVDSFFVVVVDRSMDLTERSVLKWVDPTFFTSAVADCEWTMSSASPNHVYTAFGPANSACPDALEAVGVGTDLSIDPVLAKMRVNTRDFITALRVDQGGSYGTTTGVHSLTTGGTVVNQAGLFQATSADGNQVNYGLYSVAQGVTVRSRGIHAESNDATFTGFGGEFFGHDALAQFTWGAIGQADSGSVWRVGLEGRGLGRARWQTGVGGRAEPGFCPGCNVPVPRGYYGVSGYARTPDQVLVAYGVYGNAAQAPQPGSVSWAGWFDGDVNINGAAFCTLMAWTSDASLKTNVLDVDNGLQSILQLRPVTYDFLSDQNEDLNLPTNGQIGLIADEVMDVLPEIVEEMSVAARVDSLGNVVFPARTIKGINYIALVPMLIAAVQEQNATIAQMQEQLAACCTAPTGPDQRNSLQETGTLEGLERNLLINPNPFVGETTLTYTLDHSGAMSLIANSADGKQLHALVQANMEAGQYQFDWNTANLAPGIYYVTLLLDGEPIVKKAVKVGR
jgi:Chaperone of endosialidase